MLTEFGDGATDFGDETPESIDRGDDRGVALAGVVQLSSKGRLVEVRRDGKLVGENLAGSDALGRKRCQLAFQILTRGAHPRVPEDCCHALTVSLTFDIEDLRHAL